MVDNDDKVVISCEVVEVLSFFPFFGAAETRLLFRRDCFEFFFQSPIDALVIFLSADVSDDIIACITCSYLILKAIGNSFSRGLNLRQLDFILENHGSCRLDRSGSFFSDAQPT
jgi:hypothetical protein